MARKSQNYASYTPDAFDEPPEGPVGVHRGNRAWYAVLFPYFLVLIIAVVFGLGVWASVSGNLSHMMSSFDSSQTHTSASKNPSDTSNKSNSDSASKDDSDDDFGAGNSSADKDSKNSKDSKDSKSSSDSKDSKNDSNSSNDSAPQASVNKNVAVKVVNATKINGYAASNASKLKQAGYANVTSSNPSGSVPSNSVVWYKNGEDKASAEDIAKILGISSVESEQGIKSPIVVVLCK